MFKSISMLLLSAVLLVLVVGCGSNESGSESSAAQAPSQEAQQTQQASESATSAGTKHVKHLNGKTDVPINPQRIAMTDFRLVDSLQTLGMKPVAMGSFLGQTKLEWLEGDPTAGVINLGEEVNLEAVLSASPDIILAWKNHVKVYDDLSKIAPTVVIGESGDWRADYLGLADIFGKTTEAEAWLKGYEETAAAAKAAIADKMNGKTAIFMRIMKKEFRIYGTSQVVGGILHEDLGIAVPEKVIPIERRETVSMEVLPEFNPDYIFLEVGAPVIGGDKDAQQKYEELTNSSIWKGLTAVKNNHVFLIPYWTDLDIPQANLTTLQMIEQMIVGSN